MPADPCGWAGGWKGHRSRYG